MSQPAEEFRSRSLALPVYLPTFLFAVGQGAAIPILPLIALDMGLSVPIAGLLVGLRAVGTWRRKGGKDLVVVKRGQFI